MPPRPPTNGRREGDDREEREARVAEIMARAKKHQTEATRLIEHAQELNAELAKLEDKKRR